MGELFPTAKRGKISQSTHPKQNTTKQKKKKTCKNVFGERLVYRMC